MKKLLKNRMGLDGAIASAAVAISLIAGTVYALPAGHLKLMGSTTVRPIAEASEPDILEYVGGHTITGLTIDAQGSGHGFEALGGDGEEIGTEPPTDEQPDIAMASSQRKNKHWDPIQSPGFTGLACHTGTNEVDNDTDQHKIAKDAVVVAINKELYDAMVAAGHSDPTISLTTLDAIYESQDTIDTKTWADFGFSGVSTQIVPVSRDDYSGTRDAFQSIVGIDNAKCENTIAEVLLVYGVDEQPGNPEMRGVINQSKAGGTSPVGVVGYIGLGYLDPVNYPNVKALKVSSGGGGVYPSEATVLDGSYPLSRDLWMYTMKPAGVGTGDKTFNFTNINAYMNYMKGPLGQARVRDEGFIPIYPECPDYDVDGSRRGDVFDILEVDEHWNETGAKGWHRADIDNSGRCDVFDILEVDTNWNDTW